jgi:hypothetical protein
LLEQGHFAYAGNRGKLGDLSPGRFAKLGGTGRTPFLGSVAIFGNFLAFGQTPAVGSSDT